MNRLSLVASLVGAIALAIGAGGGYWFAAQRMEMAHAEMMSAGMMNSGPGSAGSGADTPEPIFYRHPMTPEITSPVPAKDDMGMDYIPVYADSASGSAGPPGTVLIDPVTVQSIGVRTASAERRTLTRTIHTLGRVEYDEQRITRLHPKVEGWIDELYVETTGAQIAEDHILLNIYSPQLVVTQQEYLLALSNRETLRESPFPDIRRGAEELVESTLTRLRLLDVPEHQIFELTQTGQVQEQLHIHSPADGIVVNVGARQGEYVNPQTELFTVADLSHVWVLVDVFEDELPWVRVGDRVRMTVAAAPGTIFEGQLTYIYPYAESRTRTVKARLEFDNPDLLLKPDMFADVTIMASPEIDAVAVPSESVVRSGIREQVFVVREPGKFEPRDVRLGVSSDGWTQILEGIAAGEDVVVSAQFLIDSESKLREAAAKMLEAQND
ncbi:MAG: efflux RND transporter periplasmic adaptor subunit [Rhodospirillaceae bacterium]|nr:efflux RND transporter periplasmic adaptor subunit [Rhodospirillaceae bacterium]